MAGMSAALGTEGRGETISFQDKRYALLPLGVEILEGLEQWLISRARKGREETWAGLVKQGLMTREEVISKAEKFTDECIENGTYSLGSQAMNRVLFDADTAPSVEEMQARAKAVEADPAAEAERLQKLPRHVLLNKIRLFTLMLKDQDGNNASLDDVLQIVTDEEKRQEFIGKFNYVWKLSMPAPKAAGAAAS